MAETLLSLQEIRVRYDGLTVLQFSSLKVYAGEVLAIIGPNGAGKSTLLRVMGLLQQPTEGKVYFGGEEVKQEKALAIRRRMASVFQEPLLLNGTVYENAAVGLKLRGLDRRSIDQRVRPWLERLGIAGIGGRQARTLSGGEAQRTSLARALAVEPELLLLDEPFSALDPPTREELLIDLERILDETTVTTVFVTHDRDEAFMFADRVAVLVDGRLFQVGVAADVFAHPTNEEVAKFVGLETRIAAVVESVMGNVVRVGFSGGHAEVRGDLQSGERVLLCLRPEDIALSRTGGAELESNSRNQIAAKVVKILPWGAHYRVALECCGDRLVSFVSRPSFSELNLVEGGDVLATFNPAAVHVIKRS